MFSLAADGVVTEENGEEGEDHGYDKCQIELSESGEYGIEAEAAVTQNDIGVLVDRRRLSDRTVHTLYEDAHPRWLADDLGAVRFQVPVAARVVEGFFVFGCCGGVPFKLLLVELVARVDAGQNQNGADNEGDNEFRTYNVLNDFFTDEMTCHRFLPFTANYIRIDSVTSR